MFKRIRLRLRDMKTVSQLISGADKQANILGEEDPAAEHFVLSAFNLPDGTAKRVFDRIGADPDNFIGAIKQQYSDALSSVGISHDVIEDAPEPIEDSKLFHGSQPSGQAVMKSLYASKQDDKDRPLLGAHVVAVAADMEFGTVARALKAMGVDRSQLAKAAKDELDSALSDNHES